MTHPIVQEWLKGNNDAGGTIHALEIELSALQARAEALETAFDAACDYINHSPCDPDITPIQNVKWNIFKDLRESILKGEK